jgi:hypothetical protein
VLEDQTWQRLLCDALAVLALPPIEQVRVNGPGCVACDLLNDFDHAREVALGNAPGMSDRQRGLLERIDAVMRGMQRPDFECFNSEVIQRPVWQELRVLAADALSVFGWVGVAIPPLVEVQPGVWQRRLAKAEPGASCDW